MVLIWLGIALGIYTTVSSWGGSSIEITVFLYFISTGCVVGGALQLRPFATIAWCLATAAAFLRAMLYAQSVPDNGTGEIVFLTTCFALLGLACLAVAVTVIVRLWLPTTKHGQPDRQARTSE